MKTLIDQYLQAKDEEDAAAARRVELGRKITESSGHVDEGSKTLDVDGYKVQVTNIINRTVDWEAFDAAGLEHPPEKEPKRQLDVTGIKWLMENQPDTYQKIARAITAKPGRPQITIKKVEE